jgi:hypothetical protein
MSRNRARDADLGASRAPPAARRALAAFALLAGACASDSEERPRAPHPLAEAVCGTFEGGGRRLVTIPVWPHLKDADWLYVEEAPLDAPDRPDRQRVVRLSPSQGGKVLRWEAFALPEPRQFVGTWREDPPLCCVRPGDLVPLPAEALEFEAGSARTAWSCIGPGGVALRVEPDRLTYSGCAMSCWLGPRPVPPEVPARWTFVRTSAGPPP